MRFVHSTLILILGLIALPAMAQPTFSVDSQGPTATVPLLDSFVLAPITEGDILTNGLPGPLGPNPIAAGPLPPPGIEVGGAPGALGAVPGGLGILPGACLELDALSYGRDAGTTLHFSVDEFATGVAGPAGPPEVLSEGSAGTLEASADVFRYLGLLAVLVPPPVIVGNTAYSDGDGIAPSGLGGVGLFEPNPPTAGVVPDAGDNLDAIDLDTTFADLAGPIYFSLDSAFAEPLEGVPINCGTAAANLVSSADVLVVPAPGGAPLVAIPAALLGLDVGGVGTDDLDALAWDDADSSGTLTLGDTILFSVRRGSAVIGALDTVLGVPIEPGDVLTAPVGGPGFAPGIVVTAEALGLATARSLTAGPFGSDELNALDVISEEYGDAPDGIPSCQGGVACVPVSTYPTVAGTVNAVPGRTSPTHTSTAPVGGDYFLGTAPTVEPAADQPCCDWVPPETVCDEDDSGAVLCLDPTCTYGMAIAGPMAVVTCGLSWGAGQFGPPGGVPPGAAIPAAGFPPLTTPLPSFWVVPVTMGAAETPPLAGRFLNVAVDHDFTGTFGDIAGEWPITDAPVAFLPGLVQIFPSAAFPVSVTVTTTVGPPPLFLVTSTWSVDGLWSRFTVGPEPIALAPPFAAALWDGSGALGGYDRGETEDWYVVGDPAIPQGPGNDCNGNLIPDIADIAVGGLADLDGDGVPDVCLYVPAMSPTGILILVSLMLMLVIAVIATRRWRLT